MANYNGFFKSTDNKLYEVRITKNTGDTYTEIPMAGDEPFTVDYSVSDTPFAPVRTSTASINFISEDYMDDCLPSTAFETKVELIYNNEVQWFGYLTSKVYSQPYENCYEKITLNANDALLNLQYVDYETSSKSVVTFNNIMDKILTKTGVEFIYYQHKLVDGAYIDFAKLKISEMNFFSSDAEPEPWKMNEVMEEICKYLGYTAVQWKKDIYLIDYTSNEDTFYYHTLDDDNRDRFSGTFTITADKVRRNGATVSFAPIYNQVKVTDSFYKAEYLVPELFNDDTTTNRNGEDWQYINCNANAYPAPKYFNKKGNLVTDDAEPVRAYKKLYDNKYYESHYYNTNGDEVTLSESQKKDGNVTRTYAGGTLYKLANMEVSGVTANANFEEYLLISQKNNPWLSNNRTAFNTLSYRNPVVIDKNNTYVTVDCSAIFERYTNYDWINSNWNHEKSGAPKDGAIGHHSPILYFKLRIGNKWFYNDIYNTGEWRDSECSFMIPLNDKLTDNWNNDISIKNTVSWELMTGGNGYKIPLSGLSSSVIEDVYFAVLFPNTLENITTSKEYGGTNSYCYIKNLNVKLISKNAEIYQDKVWENNLSGATYVNSYGDIDCKLTTSNGLVAYSNVVWNGDMLIAINGNAPEINIINKYINQYSTPTVSETITITPIAPWYKVYDTYFEKNMIQLGGTIDYQMNTFEITAIEKK